MLQYLIVLLDDTSTSYCHYSIPERSRRLISFEDLKNGILFAMKENLTVQFIYPDYELPKEYDTVIESIDHTKIKPCKCDTANNADIIVFENIDDCLHYPLEAKSICVLRTVKDVLFDNSAEISSILRKVKRLNVVITDIDAFNEDDFQVYKHFLNSLGKEVEKLYFDGGSPQINLLTDRLLLKKMNNCNAGDSNITLAPDGRFYVCPAFYYETAQTACMGLGGPAEAPFSIGDLSVGLNIKNPLLYRFEYAPICRHCEAMHCKRCIWLNWKTTGEVNTPSRQQCVISHLERNASRELLIGVRKYGEFLPEQDIPEINYLDPFELKNY